MATTNADSGPNDKLKHHWKNWHTNYSHTAIRPLHENVVLATIRLAEWFRRKLISLVKDKPKCKFAKCTTDCECEQEPAADALDLSEAWHYQTRECVH